MLTKIKSKTTRGQPIETTDGRHYGIACGEIQRDRMSRYKNGKRLIVNGFLVLFAGVE